MNRELAVLLVEDNPGEVDLMRENLPKTGSMTFRVEAVSRLSEALDRLNVGKIDLVLLDLGLPDSQGLETLRSIRNSAPGIPIVVLTGNDSEEVASAAVREGAQDYLVKGQAGGHILVRSMRYSVDRKRAEVEKLKLEAQLLQAQKMESVGRLAGGIAHDFNNMLSVILSHAEMAMSQVDETKPLYHHLHEIMEAAGRSANLTSQLLAFARKQPISPRLLDINDAVSGMLSILARLIGEAINLVWIPGKGAQAVMIDPSQFDQILTNLAVNSRDAIAGVGTITIETSSIDVGETDFPKLVPGKYVLVSITDDGCGMSHETMANIFEPFFTTKEPGKGTGLGLATTHSIVKQNNGFINVYSEPGRGTTFRIYFPRSESTAMEASGVEAKAKTTTGAETVLLVEDEAALLEIIRQSVERLGYTVLATGDPIEALQIAEKHSGSIDLLMTDIVMPDMSGRELRRNVAARWPNVKCLYMSGYPTSSLAPQGILEAGVHFLQKPFSTGTLAAKLRETLEEDETGRKSGH
ncbi:MAG: response regulator [Candidatus Brocadiia bacterium]